MQSDSVDFAEVASRQIEVLSGIGQHVVGVVRYPVVDLLWIKLILTPLTITGIALAGRRWGPAVGGSRWIEAVTRWW